MREVYYLPLTHLHTPLPPFSPTLISLAVSVDDKHHVYLLTCNILQASNRSVHLNRLVGITARRCRSAVLVTILMVWSVVQNPRKRALGYRLPMKYRSRPAIIIIINIPIIITITVICCNITTSIVSSSIKIKNKTKDEQTPLSW